MTYLGDFAADASVHVPFTTHDGSGAAVAPSDAFEAADVRIYKNNSATQKSTANGITVTSPFDSVTGLHLLTIDTSDDTGDAGFWATGSDYFVVLVPDSETVDGQSVVRVLAHFSIENRQIGSLGTQAKADVNAEALDVLNVDTLIDSKTIVQALRIIGAAAAGEVSGAGTDTEVFVGLDGSTTRVTVTADADGNRTSVVYA